MDEGIRVVGRGFDALVHLRRTGGDTRAHIARALDLSRPTTYRILATLEHEGLIRSDADGVSYCLDAGVGRLDGGMTLQDRAVWAARETLPELQRRVVWTSHVATLGIDNMVVRESTHALNPFSIVTKAGQSTRQLLQSALGRAHLAFCPEPEREALAERLQAIEASGYPKGYVAMIVEQTRRDGFASESVGASIPAGAIALPIRCGDRVAACIDVSWIYSAVRFEEAVDRFLPHLNWAQAEIEERLARMDAAPA